MSLVRLQDIRSNIGINFIFTSSEKLEIKVYKTTASKNLYFLQINLTKDMYYLYRSKQTLLREIKGLNA